MVIIGREAELSRLRTLVDDAAEGRAGSVVLEGDAGIGKSALLDWLAATAAADGCTVLRGRCSHHDRDLGYLVLRQVLLPVRPHFDAMEPHLAEALADALGMVGSVNDGLVPVASLEALSQASTSRPVVVIVDDAHECDVPSLLALSFAARRALAERLLVVFAIRPAEMPRPSALDSLPRLPIGGLDAAASEQLATTAGQLPTADALEQAHGNPLALQHLDRLGGEAAALPERLRRGFRRVIDAYPPRTRAALGLVALAGELDPEALTAALAGIDGDHNDLALPLRDGLLATREATVAFVHPLMAAAAESAADAGPLHAALADALAGSAPDRALVHRLQAAAVRHGIRPRDGIRADDDRADDSGLIEVAEARAEVLAADGRVDDAFPLFESAAALEPVPLRRAHLLRRSAQIIGFSGRYAAAVPHFDRSLAACDDPAVQVGSLRSRAWCQLWSGQPVPVVSEPLRAALRRARDGDTEQMAMGWGSLIALFVQHDVFMARATVHEAPPHPFLAEDVLIALVLANDPAGAELLEELRRTVGTPDAPASGQLDVRSGIFTEMLLLTGQWTEADDWARAYAESVREAHVEAEFGPAMSRWMTARLFLGDGLTAHGLALAAVERQPDDLAVLGAAAYVGAVVGAPNAASWAQHCQEMAASRGLTWFALEAAHRLGLVALAAGDVPGSLAAFHESWRLMREHGYRCPSVCQARGDIAEAFALAGDDAAAREVLVELEAGPFALGWARGVAARVRGILGEPGAFDRAGELLADSPWEVGRTLLAAARATGDADAARSAVEVFDAIGARPWATQARRHLAAVDTRDALAALSDRERGVALAVSRGLSNKEVAAELYISSKTVDAHLQQIYRKLDVRSRTRLAALCQSRGVAA